MENNFRKRAFDYVISDIRNVLVDLRKTAEERCDKGHHAGAVYRLAAIESIIKYLAAVSASLQPWIYFEHEATYNTRRITKKLIYLLIKHDVIEGTDSVKDIQFLNALSKSWGLVDLIVAQMRNRLTRKKCMQLFNSHATCRWERAAETYLSNQSSKGKIRRCLVYLYSSKLLPSHDQREVQSFIRVLEKYDNINWGEAPDSILKTKHRLEQINATNRQRKKKEREKDKSR